MFPFPLAILRRYATVILLLLAVPLCRYVLAPRVLSLTDEFHYSAQVVSKDDFYDERSQEFMGESLSDTRFSYDAVGREDGMLLVRNALDVRRADGETIFSVERQYGVDPVSGRHVPGHGDRDRQGYLFAPRFLDKSDVTYWHANYNTPVTLKFQGEEIINGLRTYRYEDTFHADQTDNLGHLPFVGTARGVNLDVRLQVWFEPVSGHMVKYADQATAYYYNLATGKRLSPWNRFSNAYSAESVAQQVSAASQEKIKTLLLASYLPLLLFALSIFAACWTLLHSTTWRPKFDRDVFIATTLVFLSMAATFARWGYLQISLQSRLAASFETDTRSLSRLVTDRMNAQVGLLEAASGLFDAKDGKVDRAEWKSFTDALRLAERYRGMQGIGFTPRVVEKESHVRQVRSEGLPEYEISPPGQRPEYFPVVYLEPFDERNRRASGYDMFSEATRRMAMSAARDLGAPSLSGKVTLMQETEASTAQAGILLYVPVYDRTMPLDTLESRRRALRGYVYSPFRVENFINALLAGRDIGLDLEIYDGTEENVANPERKIYSSLPHTRRSALPRFQSTRTVFVVGRPWTFRFSSLPGYGLDSFEERMPAIVLVVGTAFSLILLGGLISIIRRKKAEEKRKSQFVRSGEQTEIL